MNKIMRVMGKRGRITIPYEIRCALGIGSNDILSFSAKKNVITVTKEKLCTNCADEKRYNLRAFVDSLSANEKVAVWAYLSHLKNAGKIRYREGKE